MIDKQLKKITEDLKILKETVDKARSVGASKAEQKENDLNRGSIVQS